MTVEDFYGADMHDGTDPLDHLRDIELVAVTPGRIRAECQRCGGILTREGSVDLYRLVEMFTEHAAGCTVIIGVNRRAVP